MTLAGSVLASPIILFGLAPTWFAALLAWDVVVLVLHKRGLIVVSIAAAIFISVFYVYLGVGLLFAGCAWFLTARVLAFYRSAMSSDDEDLKVGWLVGWLIFFFLI